MKKAKKKLKKPTLFLTLGYPGSGKTYFSTRFAKEIGAVHLRSDSFRRRMFDKPAFTWSETKVLFGALNHAVDKILESGTSVILDAVSTQRSHRRAAMRQAKKLHARYVLLWIQTPIELAIKRVEKRERNVSHKPVTRKHVEQFHREQQDPFSGEPYVIVNGTIAYGKQKAMVMKFLKAKELIEFSTKP